MATKERCRRCYQRAFMRRYNRENPDRARAERQQRYEKNRAAIREQQRDYYYKNRDTILERGRRYYQDHRDKRREYSRRWREANKDKHRESVQLWYESNPDKKAEYQRQRRARKQNALHIPFTDAELAARLSMFENECVYCGGPFEEIDHLIPLARGGPHCLSNLRPACHPCNLSKGVNTPGEWAGRQAP